VELCHYTQKSLWEGSAEVCSKIFQNPHIDKKNQLSTLSWVILLLSISSYLPANMLIFLLNKEDLFVSVF